MIAVTQQAGDHYPRVAHEPSNNSLLYKTSMMDLRHRPDVLMTPAAQLPTSPPITPDSGPPAPVPSRHHPNLPQAKRMGLIYGDFDYSPPINDDDPLFKRIRTTTPELLSVPRSRSQQSRTSSRVGGSPARQFSRSTPEIDSVSEASDGRSSLRPRTECDDDELEIEEIADDDSVQMSQSRILLPDDYEDALSERAASPFSHEHSEMYKQFAKLNHGETNGDAMYVAFQRWSRRKKRRSEMSKRTFSNRSSDSDNEDTRTLDFNEVGASARRVRRRMSGVRQRTSLIFDDPPPEHITEVDEPDDETHVIDAPPLYEEVDWLYQLRCMPFYDYDPMALDKNDIDDDTSDDGSDSGTVPEQTT